MTLYHAAQLAFFTAYVGAAPAAWLYALWLDATLSPGRGVHG